MTNRKKQLGQFFTKQSDYILQGLERYILGKNVADPFAGSGDLLAWAQKNGAKKIVGFDVDPKLAANSKIKFNDSLLNPLKYEFVVTNPPYLNINKAAKEIKNRYFANSEFEDLYQISLSKILDSEEGIVIVPVNFLSAFNSREIRKLFFTKFQIIQMNYFKQQVFPDTTYNVVAFYYRIKPSFYEDKFSIHTFIYPDSKSLNISLYRQYDWTIGGEITKKVLGQKNTLGIERLTLKEIKQARGDIEINAAFNHVNEKQKYKISKELYDKIRSNILLLKAIDSGTEAGRIAIENIKNYGVDCLVSKESSRHMIHLIFENHLSLGEQKILIDLFNKEINKLRNDYLSLFLTNYRDNDRKRISFEFVYKYLNYLYFREVEKGKIYGQHKTPQLLQQISRTIS